MKQGAARACDVGERAHGLNRADLVVRMHDRHERRVGAHRGPQRVGLDDARGADGEQRGRPAAPFERLERREDGFVFDRRGDQMAASGHVHHVGRAAHGHVVGLGAAGREDDVARLGADQRGDFGARVVERRLRALPVRVHGRGVAELLGEHAGDERGDLRMQGGSRVVVEVYPQCSQCLTVYWPLGSPQNCVRCVENAMWKRDDAVAGQPQQGGQGTAPQQTPGAAPDRQESSKVNIGKSVIIKGELSGSEDLTIEGQVDGKIELRQNVLTIGPNGRIKAEVFAKAVIVQGEVTGNITATEKVDIRDAGSVDGDLAAPRIAIADGAHFRGSIDMKRDPAAAAKADAKPAGAPGQAGAPAGGQKPGDAKGGAQGAGTPAAGGQTPNTSTGPR
jgi:cytoskeletal protein CcmA (bactofilin family)